MTLLSKGRLRTEQHRQSDKVDWELSEQDGCLISFSRNGVMFNADWENRDIDKLFNDK
tara:strand:+ start:1359 stop:1532 length:174 start_codon:yes stop_codon:yes gene_type:complete